MKEEFKSSFVAKYVLNWWGLLILLFALWAVLFRSTFSIYWKIGYAAGIIFIIANGMRYIIKYHINYAYLVIVTDDALIIELFAKERIKIRWDEIVKIEEEQSGFTSIFTVYFSGLKKKIYIAGFHILNFYRLQDLLRQKIKEFNIPYEKVTRWI